MRGFQLNTFPLKGWDTAFVKLVKSKRLIRYPKTILKYGKSYKHIFLGTRDDFENKFSGLKIYFQYYILDNNLLTRCFGTVKFDVSFWPVLVILKKKIKHYLKLYAILVNPSCTTFTATMNATF